MHDQAAPLARGGEPDARPEWEVTFRVSARTARRVLLGTPLALVLLGLLTVPLARLSLANPWAVEVQQSLVRLFSLDLEGNVPTWYSSFLLLACGALAAAHARQAHGRGPRLRWGILALLWVVMSVDEAAALHEMSLKPMRALLHTTGLLYYAWILPGAALAAVVALSFWRFLWALARPARARLFLGASVFLVGALGVEAITGSLQEQYGRHLAYDLTVVLEEALELVGATLMLTGLLTNLGLEAHARSSASGGRRRLDPAPEPVAGRPD